MSEKILLTKLVFKYFWKSDIMGILCAKFQGSSKFGSDLNLAGGSFHPTTPPPPLPPCS